MSNNPSGDVVVVTYRDTNDEGSAYLIDLVMTREQHRDYRTGQWAPAVWWGHPTQVYGPDRNGLPVVVYDVTPGTGNEDEGSR